jgi:hypothetical protein
MSAIKGEPTFVELSWVEITDQDVEKVADVSGLSLERIRRYLDSEEQDNNILRYFALIRVYPRGKLFQSYKQPV